MPAPSPRRKSLPIESLLTLRRRLDELPRRHADRLALIAEVALLYDVSPATVYRSLRDVHQPKVAGRRDRGQSRVLPTTQMERYCELVAA